jgi:hypothetical protein
MNWRHAIFCTVEKWVRDTAPRRKEMWGKPGPFNSKIATRRGWAWWGKGARGRGKGKLFFKQPTNISFLPSDNVPEFNCTLSHHIEFSHPAQRAEIYLKWKADRPVWKNLLENAASWHAAAAKIPPFLCQSATGKIRAALSPALCTPLNGRKDKSPYYQLVVVNVPTVTVVVP